MLDPEEVEQITGAIRQLATAITPNCTGNRDAADVHVSSLTEAAMGITAGLVQIADAIDRLVDTVRDCNFV